MTTNIQAHLKVDESEKWSHIFWDRGTDFRDFFDRLDLSCAIELGCAKGIHSKQAAALAHYLMVFDTSEEKLSECKTKLSGVRNVAFMKGDGSSFQPVANATVTSIFSYDAMVLLDTDTVRKYLNDASRVLARNGMALFHHSNNAADPESPFRTMPHGRQFMTRERFSEYAVAAGLKVIESKVRQWGGVANLDCLTLLQKP